MRLALLFGSWARNAANGASDVDVAVLAPGADLLGIAAALGREVGVDVDVVDIGAPTIPLMSELIDDGIVLYEKEPGDYASWRARTLVQLETDRPWYARMRDAWLTRVADKGL